MLQRILEEFLRNRPIAIALAPIRIDFIEFFLGYGANGISDKTFLVPSDFVVGEKSV